MATDDLSCIQQPGPALTETSVSAVSLAEVLERTPSIAAPDSRPHPTGEVALGVLNSLGPDGVPQVVIEGEESGQPLSALSIVKVSASDVGRRVVLAFHQGRLDQPIILGFLRPGPERTLPSDSAADRQVVVDGETLRIEAKQKIELHCGKASIVLSADGKVLIRGEYVVSRASGTNRIRGGNVQIN